MRDKVKNNMALGIAYFDRNKIYSLGTNKRLYAIIGQTYFIDKMNKLISNFSQKLFNIHPKDVLILFITGNDFNRSNMSMVIDYVYNDSLFLPLNTLKEYSYQNTLYDFLTRDSLMQIVNSNDSQYDYLVKKYAKELLNDGVDILENNFEF